MALPYTLALTETYRFPNIGLAGWEGRVPADRNTSDSEVSVAVVLGSQMTIDLGAQNENVDFTEELEGAKLAFQDGAGNGLFQIESLGARDSSDPYVLTFTAGELALLLGSAGGLRFNFFDAPQLDLAFSVGEPTARANLRLPLRARDAAAAPALAARVRLPIRARVTADEPALAADVALSSNTWFEGSAGEPTARAVLRYSPISVSTASGGYLRYEATGLPEGLVFDPVTRQISGTPTAIGSGTITVTVTDLDGVTDSYDIPWEVEEGKIVRVIVAATAPVVAALLSAPPLGETIAAGEPAVVVRVRGSWEVLIAAGEPALAARLSLPLRAHRNAGRPTLAAALRAPTLGATVAAGAPALARLSLPPKLRAAPSAGAPTVGADVAEAQPARTETLALTSVSTDETDQFATKRWQSAVIPSDWLATPTANLTAQLNIFFNGRNRAASLTFDIKVGESAVDLVEQLETAEWSFLDGDGNVLFAFDNADTTEPYIHSIPWADAQDLLAETGDMTMRFEA